jgi:hypothetical protein
MDLCRLDYQTKRMPSIYIELVLCSSGLSALWVAILFNLVFAYLFEHSLIAVDVNQSLIEIGGVYFCAYIFDPEQLHSFWMHMPDIGIGVFRAKRQKRIKIGIETPHDS